MAKKWQDEKLFALPVAVNVSALQFRQEGFPDLVKHVLLDTGLAPQYLELELTESLLLSNARKTLQVLQQLKSMGVRMSIDDFGTGYSSLSYLRHFPVDKLKIDRSFIRTATLNPDDAAIAAAIINLAKSLNLKVIAEGVESEAQLSFLRSHHCDEIQGHYFSKPMTAEEVAQKVEKQPAHLRRYVSEQYLSGFKLTCQRLEETERVFTVAGQCTGAWYAYPLGVAYYALGRKCVWKQPWSDTLKRS